jgi:hypothetical protein
MTPRQPPPTEHDELVLALLAERYRPTPTRPPTVVATHPRQPPNGATGNREATVASLPGRPGPQPAEGSPPRAGPAPRPTT